MPLAKRIIPTLLVRGRQLVKGQQFNSWRSVGHAVQAVRIHQARGVDELMLLDITGFLLAIGLWAAPFAGLGWLAWKRLGGGSPGA